MRSKPARPPNRHSPISVRVDEIHIPLKDHPPSGTLPPEGRAFASLKEHLKRNGLMVPIFIDKDKVLLQGHYRYWAWKALGNEYINALMVTDDANLEWHLHYYFGGEG